MDTTKKIRLWKLITLLLSVSICPLQIAAKKYTMEFKESDTLSARALDMTDHMISKQGIEWGELADFDVSKLKNADTLYLFLRNEHIELYAIFQSKDVNCSYTHYESFDKNAQAYVSILENNVYADLSTSIGTYNLHSISDTKVIVVKYEADIAEEPENSHFAKEEDMSEEEVHVIRDATPPVLRVLFLYTHAALNLVGSSNPNAQMRQVVYDYINKANESFVNSNINARIQLAYIGPTNYNEASQTWANALKHFSNNNDGYMDEVHTLRNKYAADICVLFLDKDDYCGEAKTITANATTAFCIVHPTYGCNFKFTAVHEIGHLVGCRHNYSNDVNLVPYPYCHGYIHYVENNPNNSWRTMMSYDNSCETGCKRIPYWSNPNVTYNSIPMGNTSLANNARVWNNRASTVADFRTTHNQVVYTSANNNYSSIYENVEAETQISTGSGYEIQSGQIVDFLASSYIRLGPNTNIKRGAKFRAYISDSAGTNNYPQFTNKRDENNVDISHNKSDISIPISPNPAKDVLKIQYDGTLKDVFIYNALGKVVYHGCETLIPVYSLPDGVYILCARTDDGDILQTKFLHQQ